MQLLDKMSLPSNEEFLPFYGGILFATLSTTLEKAPKPKLGSLKRDTQIFNR
jgi:hypothetical protein